jgi:hypothetical protein
LELGRIGIREPVDLDKKELTTIGATIGLHSNILVFFKSLAI